MLRIYDTLVSMVEKIFTVKHLDAVPEYKVSRRCVESTSIGVEGLHVLALWYVGLISSCKVDIDDNA